MPKDFSTLALEIRTDAWEAAGLTDDDIPTTWEELADVAQTLTTGEQVGLVVGDTRDRIGAFMVQAGGWVTNEDGTEVTADSPENVEALEYVKGLLDAGVLQYPPALDSGWGGEAFGTGKAAMTIEGNWIKGAMTNDYPDVDVHHRRAPRGPGRQGHAAVHPVLGHRGPERRQGRCGRARRLPDRDRAAARRRRGVRRHAVAPVRERRLPRAVPRRRGLRRRRRVRPGSGQRAGHVERAGRLRRRACSSSQTGDPAQILATLQTNAEAVIGG